MSKGNNEALIRISAIVGCFHVLDAKRAFARIDIKELVTTGRGLAYLAVRSWDGDNSEKHGETINKLHSWGIALSAREAHLTDACILYMIERFLSDLEHAVKNRKKAGLLQGIRGIINQLSEFSNAAGDRITDFREGDKLVDLLQELIDSEKKPAISRTLFNLGG